MDTNRHERGVPKPGRVGAALPLGARSAAILSTGWLQRGASVWWTLGRGSVGGSKNILFKKGFLLSHPETIPLWKGSILSLPAIQICRPEWPLVGVVSNLRKRKCIPFSEGLKLGRSVKHLGQPKHILQKKGYFSWPSALLPRQSEKIPFQKGFASNRPVNAFGGSAASRKLSPPSPDTSKGFLPPSGIESAVGAEPSGWLGKCCGGLQDDWMHPNSQETRTLDFQSGGRLTSCS